MGNTVTHLFLVISVTERAHHSALRPERAVIEDVERLSWQEVEVKPLDQLGHHHLGLHLQTHHQAAV